MSHPLKGLPKELVTADLSKGSASIVVDETIYPLEALYGAAFVFIDRCWVLLDKPAEGQFRVTLTPKGEEVEEEMLRAWAGEFSNELLSNAWRAQIFQENRALIEAVTMQAIGGAMGPADLDDLASFDFSDDAFEDPLGIAQSWEEKYKKGTEADDEGSKADNGKKEAEGA